ncbi:ester cyclase [Saccharothrix deserti]|uniref:ester cyclase n=1 Tax=Saccharothrix deserti TaxID=2593674 RepID=UPI00131DB30B|nr:ester cyclase family protein [Saccharothrix deserti]
MTTKEELRRLDDVGIASWDRHDPDAFVNLFADNFEWVDDSLPAPMRSREEARRFTESWFTAFPDMHLREINRVVGDDSVASEVEFTGTNQGPLNFGDRQIPPTGKKVSSRSTVFARIENGKIKEFHTHPDAIGLMAQLGVVDSSLSPSRAESAMSREDLIRLDDQQTEAFNRGDADAFINTLADDFVWIDDVAPEPIRDRDSARRYVQTWMTAFPDMRVRVTNRVVGDDSVADELELTGTNSGELDLGGGNRVPATRRKVAVRGSSFIRARNGKITEFHSYSDNMSMLTQLGLAEAPA